MAHKSQKNAILAILKHSAEPLGISDLTNKITVPQRTLRRWLSQWAANEILEKTGRGRATTYRYLDGPPSHATQLKFLINLDKDLQLALLKQLRDLWTHNSTAIEGNTLSLGDTHFILEEGLTISGKPVKDHQEIIGHAKAIDLLYSYLNIPLNEKFIFDLHKAIQTEIVIDIYKPIGNWKLEKNGTYVINKEGVQTFIEYALPTHVPALMSELIEMVNNLNEDAITLANAHQYYAKIHMGIVHIHPFWDGNGRIARLIANVPLLKAGLPPIIIPQSERQMYIQTLANYQIDIGQINPVSGIWPDIKKLAEFESFCQAAYSATTKLIQDMDTVQDNRR